jgi:endonuclease YncB( thermonuclease family)
MSRLIVFILFLLSINSYATDKYMILPIDEVHDGDTIKTHISEYRLVSPLNQLSVRIKGIDTPEMPADSYRTTGLLGRAKCVREAELALKAKAIVEGLKKEIDTKMYIYNPEWDKYGGRILARVTINGVDVGELLIKEGLAVIYNGEKKTTDWCQLSLSNVV